MKIAPPPSPPPPFMRDDKVYGSMTLTSQGWQMQVHKFIVRDRKELDYFIDIMTKLREFVKDDTDEGNG